MTIEKDYNINTQYGNFDRTLLIESVMSGNLEMVQTLIDSGVDLEVKHKWGDTALLFSAGVFTDNNEIASLLIKSGANVNVYNPKHDSTPLAYTIYANKYAVAQELLDNGADINWANRDGLTPLMLALSHNNIDLAYLFIKKGADINRQNSIGWNALIYAIIGEYADLVELLLSKRIKFNIEDNYGDNAMQFALRCKDSTIKDILIKYGVDGENLGSPIEYDILVADKSLFFLKRNFLRITNKRVLLEEKTPLSHNKTELYLYQLINCIIRTSYGTTEIIEDGENFLSNNNLPKISLDLNYESIAEELEFIMARIYRGRKGYLSKEEIDALKFFFVD